jgi:hypothetical protein
MLGYSWDAEQLMASQEGLSCMELVQLILPLYFIEYFKLKTVNNVICRERSVLLELLQFHTPPPSRNWYDFDGFGVGTCQSMDRCASYPLCVHFINLVPRKRTNWSIDIAMMPAELLSYIWYWTIFSFIPYIFPVISICMITLKFQIWLHVVSICTTCFNMIISTFSPPSMCV